MEMKSKWRENANQAQLKCKNKLLKKVFRFQHKYYLQCQIKFLLYKRIEVYKKLNKKINNNKKTLFTQIFKLIQKTVYLICQVSTEASE